MQTSKWCWALAAALGIVGATVVAVAFDPTSPWFFLGLTALIAAGSTVNTAWLVRRSRTLDEEFDCGYRVGHRAGRRAGAPQLVHLDDRRRDGRVSKAPLGSMAGVDSTPRRAAAHQD